MPYLLKLGPVQLQGASTNVYLRVKDSGEVAPPAFGLNDVDGLRELLGEEPGTGFECERALEDAGQALGVTVTEPPQRVLQSRAAIAVFMAWSQRGVSAAGSDMALLFLQAATEFWNAHPWVYWEDRQPLEIRCQGSVERPYEASIFGSKEQGYGLALYEDAGALGRLVALQASGDSAAARQLPAIGVMLDDKPAYAVEALVAGGTVPRVPIPVRSDARGASVPNPAECLTLVAALRAIGSLSPAMRQSACASSARGLEVTVNVHAPPARVRN